MTTGLRIALLDEREGRVRPLELTTRRLELTVAYQPLFPKGKERVMLARVEGVPESARIVDALLTDALLEQFAPAFVVDRDRVQEREKFADELRRWRTWWRLRPRIRLSQFFQQAAPGGENAHAEKAGA